MPPFESGFLGLAKRALRGADSGAEKVGDIENMRKSAGRWCWVVWERVRLRGKQVDSSGGTGEWGGCTVRYNNDLHVRHVLNVSERCCCTHGRTRGANVERCIRIVFLTEFSEIVCITCMSCGWKFVKIRGCYRFRNWQLIAVDCYENVSVHEVLVVIFLIQCQIFKVSTLFLVQ
jgi:hypothetical protein